MLNLAKQRPDIHAQEYRSVARVAKEEYRRVVTDRQATGKRLRPAFEDICAFERQLTDDGVVIVKCFLHISKKEQKRRFDSLRASAARAWRVTEDDLRQHKRYAKYLAAAEDMLIETDADYPRDQRHGAALGKLWDGPAQVLAPHRL